MNIRVIPVLDLLANQTPVAAVAFDLGFAAVFRAWQLSVLASVRASSSSS